MFISESIQVRATTNLVSTIVATTVLSTIYILQGELGNANTVSVIMVVSMLLGATAVFMPSALVYLLTEHKKAKIVANTAAAMMTICFAVMSIWLTINNNQVDFTAAKIVGAISVMGFAAYLFWSMATADITAEEKKKHALASLPFGIGLFAALFMLKKRQEA